MITLTLGVAVALVALPNFVTAAPSDQPLAATRIKVPDKVAGVYRTFEPGEVTILDGPFKAAHDASGKYLLSLEPDRLLAGFREVAGLPKKAERYGGWESRNIAGHSLGHYLSAIAYEYAESGDKQWLDRANYIVDELAACQEANAKETTPGIGRGFLVAFDDGKRIFSELARGDIRTQGFDLNGGWVPWYTIHKQLAGLRDVYLYTGNQKALDVALAQADWAIELTKNFSDADWQKMLMAEHGGMNEVLADLYAITGERKYDELARHFYHRAILDPLADGRDILPGKHANTNIPKLIGLARLYELDGDERFERAATYFWNRVVDSQMYANGGNSLNEHFQTPNTQGLHQNGQTSETCNTYNMLKLTRHLFAMKPDMKLADFAERATFNHILASIDPSNGQVFYFARMGQGMVNEYSTPTESFWCCVGTGMENHTRYGDQIYFKNDDSLTVNLFIASEAHWAEKNVVVRQETRFPDEAATRFVIRAPQPTPFTLRVRYPNWATADAAFTLNGQPLANVSGKPGSYVEITRTWNDGDTLALPLPATVREEATPDMPTRRALFWGPILLAGETTQDKTQHPILLATDRPADQWVKPEGGELMFKTSGVGQPGDVELKPLYRVRAEPHTVYFDFYTPQQWAQHQAELRAEQERQRELAARTVDSLAVGEMQPERDHDFASQNAATGTHMDRKWRHAENGGFMEFTMKVDGNAANELAIDYWGSDAGNRQFDLLIDGKTLASETLENNEPGKFYTQLYTLDRALTDGKASVRVRFQAKPGRIAGGVYGAKMLRVK